MGVIDRAEFRVKPGRPVFVFETAENQHIAPIVFGDPGVVLQLTEITVSEQDYRRLDALAALVLRQREVQPLNPLDGSISCGA